MAACSPTLEGCLQQEPPSCTAACPFRLDVLDFIAKVRRGAFHPAFRAFAGAVGFPGLVAALCPGPCRRDCPRESAGGAIELNRLERAVLAQARGLDPVAYNLPAKSGRVAIVGAGPAGLGCALRLAGRKYQVTVFEREGRTGGHLNGLLPPEEVAAEIRRQFSQETLDLRLGSEVRDLEALAFDAVLVATGSGGERFGLDPDPGGAFASTRPGVFLAGSLLGADAMGALAEGLRAARALERWMKVGAMNEPREPEGTRLRVDIARVAPEAPVAPASGGTYAKEEAQAEAGRCLACACDACVKACDLMAYFRKFPRRIAEEVHLTVHPGTLDGNGTLATRLLSTCNQCGLCREVCPEGIDTGEIFRNGHHAMRAKGAMPWAWHEPFLRDMASANGEASLALRPRGVERSRFLFFPGCQLGASDPAYVTESYRFLRDRWPDTALALGCCGAPAEWAGDDPLAREVAGRWRETWEAFGRPTLLLACPTCGLQFRRTLPEIPAAYLYPLLRDAGTVLRGQGPLAVFDPCASRHEPDLQASVRAMAAAGGFTLESLPLEGERAACCSWGGQVSLAHPPFARTMARTRSEASGAPYLTYCSNCRDTFAAAGKPAWHVLDLAFGLGGPDRQPPPFTTRAGNRLALRRRVLEEFWGEASPTPEAPMNLTMTDELRRRLSEAMILESELREVVEDCERSGRKLLHPDTGAFTGRGSVGHLTLWATYRPLPDGFEILNAYTHRMAIEEAGP
jgi:Fe-S oxidoreductase